MFRLAHDEILDGDTLMDFIRSHELDNVRYTELKNQYLTKAPILYQEDKEPWKPDDRIPVNFGKYLVDTFNGFFIGQPVRAVHEDDRVNEVIKNFWRYNGMDNVLNETGKMTSIFGHGYWYVYQNEESKTEVAYNEPFDMFIIYTDEIRPKALYGIRYVRSKGGEYSGQLFTDEQEYLFSISGSGLTLTVPTDEFGNEIGRHYYGRVPIIEVVENEERLSLITPVEHLINSYNRVLSEKSNDVSYFADAYLAVLGAVLDDESLERLVENRVINLAGQGTENVRVEFLQKPDADQTQEHFLDRAERLIFQTSMVVNLNDDSINSGAGNSGVALERKEQPMAHMALNKERKFTQSLQTLFGMVFNVVGNVPSVLRDEYKNISYNWKRNLPANNGYEADTVRKLDGIVSKRKQLEMLTVVEDVDDELERIEEEVEVVEEEEVLKDEVLEEDTDKVNTNEGIQKLNNLIEGK